MRFSAALLLVVMLCIMLSTTSAFIFPAVTYTKMFATFIRNFNKRYDAKTFTRRLLTFKKNVDTVSQANSGGGPQAFKINSLSDLTRDEFNRLSGALPLTASEMAAMPTKSADDLIKASFLEGGANDKPPGPGPAKGVVGLASLPKSFDWRTENGGRVFGKVKHQYQCGSCWSFAAIGVIEALRSITSGVRTPLAEAHALSCTDPAKSNCIGGHSALVWRANKEGRLNFYKQSDFPYTADSGMQPELCTRASSLKAESVKVTGYGMVKAEANGNDDNIRLVLYNMGPLVVYVHSREIPLFNFHSKGIIQPENCSNRPYDHAVILTGWGTDPATKQDYYVIRNSWGEDWGEKGYYKLRRTSKANTCQIKTAVQYAQI